MLDTRAVAEYLNTTPKTLRQFLRSPQSTFTAVGSSSRYEFTQRDLPTIQKRFSEWSAGRSPVVVTPTRAPRVVHLAERRTVDRDRAVWDEEGPITLADLRDPRVRAQVRAIAQEQERRLDEMLLAVGLHVTQMMARAS